MKFDTSQTEINYYFKIQTKTIHLRKLHLTLLDRKKRNHQAPTKKSALPHIRGRFSGEVCGVVFLFYHNGT